MTVPLCFAVRLGGRWIGVCRYGRDEHRTLAGHDTRAQAVQAAQEIAARLEAARKEVQHTD
ncbi:MAG: hypothetical protein IRZ28_01450 [Steroidobacteraceae bacterium]|nr:hypothetical protein [Steroidobacteraceae bacterium]